MEDRQRLDTKTALQQVTQQKRGMLPAHRVVSESRPDHEKTFVVEVRLGGQVVGVGRGRSKKEAGQDAAKHALENEAPRRV